ncbi:FtsJ-like methyltransferase [Prosthecobacter fusiformis]|uniref:FtsJ-like methyltransferase n=1 Tax=Prosthecobacter fusiformis TaxID=48464 RepID=A0A4R7S3A8_9BACT|nr:SAM-dependent methyltransferase [Prosthecobacter fusiformis]TDU72872.1 FtsJ-like methyltransferase [Prosthecobacter fusiformis]
MLPTFLFATCRFGSEPALKREVAARYAGLLTPAFMRPQLITWKIQGELPPDFRFGGLFAQVAGISLGMAESAAEVPALLSTLSQRPALLHVFPREVPEDGVPEETWARVDALEAELTALLDLPTASAPRPAEYILDVIVGAPGEPMLVGLHQYQPGEFKTAGGLSRMQLPPESPSRAWLKMEQSLIWLGVENELKGRVVLELGSAPGGATLSLLNRGATVYGVDTGAMDERVLAHPQFHHLRVSAGDLQPSMLPDQVDVLVSDINLEPRIICQYVEKFASRLPPLGLILTLKLNSAKVEQELPPLIQKVRHWAPGPVYTRQLPANRREVTLVSWAER